MTDLLGMALDNIKEAEEKIEEMSSDERARIGSVAMELIGDYPLYGSMSNISNEEAILIALVIDGKDFIENLEVEKE